MINFKHRSAARRDFLLSLVVNQSAAMESMAGAAVMIQGDAVPRSRKKRLLSIEHNATDNSYKAIEMDEYKQEINDKIEILRLELWKSRKYQVSHFTHRPFEALYSLSL